MQSRRQEPPPRLVVVSYRGPVTLEHRKGSMKFRRGEGGLVAALDPVMKARGGYWIAAGEPPPGVPSGTPFPLPDRPQVQVVYLSVPPKLHEGHYLGFSNRALWPLCHGFPSRMRFRRSEFTGYLRVNELFAKAVREHTSRGDLVWVHDYHFALLPALLRAEAPGRRISSFWHIPFPPYELLRSLPFHEEIVAGMLGADSVFFHLDRYASAFRDAAREWLDDRDRTADGRPVRIGARPIGIDSGTWAALGRDPDVIREARALRNQCKTDHVILGVDRLDYTKGILERILAVERLLETDASMRGRFTLVQVAVPSRSSVPEYRRMRSEIDETVGRVNGRFSQGSYMPVRYFYRSLPRKTLAAFYRAADIGLVTPLRDGMNLVSMEFMMLNADRAPILILSELAGASDVLDGALRVNPIDLDGVAEALKGALVMSEDERRARSRMLVEKIRGLDVHAWAAGIVEDLSASPRNPTPDGEETEEAADVLGTRR